VRTGSGRERWIPSHPNNATDAATNAITAPELENFIGKWKSRENFLTTANTTLFDRQREAFRIIETGRPRPHHYMVSTTRCDHLSTQRLNFDPLAIDDCLR